MANVITGKVLSVLQPRTFTKQDNTQGFTQEIILDCSVERNGKKIENFPSVEISDTIDGQCVQLIKVGATLSFYIDIRGRYYEDKTTREFKHINNVRCYNITQPVEEAPRPRIPASPVAATPTNTMQAGAPISGQYPPYQEQHPQSAYPFPMP